MDITQHYPALLIVIPLIAAPLCALLHSGRMAWLLSLAVNICCLAITGCLTAQVFLSNEIRYDMGGWPVPYGIEYRIDALNVFVLLLISLIGTVSMLYARASVAQEIQAKRHSLFYSAYLLCFTGLLGITITGDAFNVFVFLEVSSLSTYALVAMGKDRRALTAAYRYLVMGTIAATFILIGIGLIYMLTGTLNMDDMYKRLHSLPETRTQIAAFAFLTVGIALKLALFPMHRWLPNAYAFAPSVVSVFVAATATKVALYLLLRFFYTIFGEDFSFGEMHLNGILLPVSLLAIFFASLTAIFKENLKRMLAYSSVAQIGYMSLGISLYSETGLTGAILHSFNHGLMKGTLFMAVGCIVYRVGKARITSIDGLAKRMPWTFGAFVIGGLSIIGIPLTAGFVSKWYLVLGAIENGWWPIAGLVLLTSLMAVVYIWRVIERACFNEPTPELANVKEAPFSLLFPTWILALANIYFGIDTRLTVGLATRAAEALMGGG